MKTDFIIPIGRLNFRMAYCLQIRLSIFKQCRRYVLHLADILELERSVLQEQFRKFRYEYVDSGYKYESTIQDVAEDIAEVCYFVNREYHYIEENKRQQMIATLNRLIEKLEIEEMVNKEYKKLIDILGIKTNWEGWPLV